MFGLQISDAVKDLIINIINIIVLFVIVKSLAYKPVKNFLDARKARIDESLKNAESKNAEADTLKAQYEDALKQSKQESDKIIGEAELSAKKRAAEITSDADKKAADTGHLQYSAPSFHMEHSGALHVQEILQWG